MATPPYRFFLLPLALLQLLAGYVPAATGFGTDIGTRMTRDGIPPELPPGPFFAIWGIIFAAYLAFGLYALKRDNELVRRLAPPLALAGLSNVFWMLVAQTLAITLLETLILLPLIYGSWAAAWQFDTMRGMGGSVIKWVSDLLTGLLSGWAIVALSISLPRLGREFLGQGPTDSEWISLWVVVATISIGAWVYRLRISRTIWYYVAISWGVLGVIVNNWTRTGFGYFGWIALFFGGWLIYRRVTAGAYGAKGRKTV